TYLAAMLVPFFIYRQRIGIPLEVALPMRAPRASLVVAGTFLTLALSSVGNIAADNLSALLRTVGLYAPQSRVALPTDAGGITLYVLIYAVLSPVLEELVFRGVILQSLRRFGDGFALIISAALFSLVHLDLLSLPYAFLAGLVIGYFVLRTGSLVTGLVIHLANNLFAVLYEALGRGLTPTQGALVSAIVFCFYLVLGLAAFVFAARRDARIFTLIPSQTALSEKAKLRLFSSSGTMLLFLVLTAIIISSGLSTSLHLW
ncbi:MAG: lysostaphin resistance A-like protein, partial [Acetanaerobacterium sp.]